MRRKLLSRIVAFTDTEGIIDTEGVIRPFFTAKLFDRSELLDAARTFLDELYSPILRKYDGYRWCDDTPLNASRASFLAELYPQMRLIHMVRDPRDVVASYRDQLWASDSIEREVFRLSEMYKTLFAEEARVSAEYILRVRLEDLVDHYEATRDRLCEHLDLDPAGFDFADRLSRNSIGRAKRTMSRSDLAIIEKQLGPFIARTSVILDRLGSDFWAAVLKVAVDPLDGALSDQLASLRFSGGTRKSTDQWRRGPTTSQ